MSLALSNSVPMRKFQDQLLIKELCPTDDSARYDYSDV